MVYQLKKVLYRAARRIYVLRKSPLKEWGTVLHKKKKQILFDAIILRYDGSGQFQEEIDFLKEQNKQIIFPYRNINRLNNAGGKNTPNSMTIASALQNEEYDGLFIKMDIEGAEPEVVKSCESWMDTNKDIRFACCTYHKKDHAEILKSIFEKHHYGIEFADGYMLVFSDKHLSYPYFRKGIIRATNKINFI